MKQELHRPPWLDVHRGWLHLWLRSVLHRGAFLSGAGQGSSWHKHLGVFNFGPCRLYFLPSPRERTEMFMLFILSFLEWSTASCTAFEWRSCPTAKVQDLWNSQASWCHRTGFVRLFQKRSASVMGYGRESSLWMLCVLYQFLMGWTIP